MTETAYQSTDNQIRAALLRSTRGNSLAIGLPFMSSLTVAQRLVGLARSVLCCGMLQSPDDVWARPGNRGSPTLGRSISRKLGVFGQDVRIAVGALAH